MPSLIHVSMLGMSARPFNFPVGRSRGAAILVSLLWSFLLVWPIAILSVNRGRSPLLKPSSRHRPPLLLDKPDMVQNVRCDSLQQDFQGQRPVTRVTTLPLEVIRFQRPENS